MEKLYVHTIPPRRHADRKIKIPWRIKRIGTVILELIFLGIVFFEAGVIMAFGV